MTTSSVIFSPLKLGKYELKHRIVLAPLSRMRANDDGVPNDSMKEYYSQRATDGGLLISEATSIDINAGSYPNAPGIYSKDQIVGWKKITDEVHSKGSVIFMQLWHIGHVASPSLNEKLKSTSGSDTTDKDTNQSQETDQGFTIPEIHDITGRFRQTALNAMEAGFDGVEIHSANGYLLDQFINTCSNKRTDIYGGSIENRARFALEVVDTIVEAIGAERTAIRFSPISIFQDMKDDTPYKTWGYLTNQLQVNHPKLAYVHFIEPRTDQAGDHNQKTFDSLDPFRKAWKGTFISAGGYTLDKELAFDEAERTGNLIAFGRHFVANPDLVERLRNGWTFNKYDRSTFYGGDAIGYTDYPFYKE